MSFLDPLLAPLQYEFMVRALATTVVAAVVCAAAVAGRMIAAASASSMNPNALIIPPFPAAEQ